MKFGWSVTQRQWETFKKLLYYSLFAYCSLCCLCVTSVACGVYKDGLFSGSVDSGVNHVDSQDNVAQRVLSGYKAQNGFIYSCLLLTICSWQLAQRQLRRAHPWAKGELKDHLLV